MMRILPPFPAHYFQRQDESDDELFYSMPRLAVHIDENAIAAVTHLFRMRLPENGRILDLMSSWKSHLPEDLAFHEVVGLGMNATEMRENEQLDRYVSHNLNVNPVLPFQDAEFDAVTCVVSVQYMIHPLEVFSEVGRILRPGGPFIVTFSNRCFPTKAVYLWLATDDARHAQIVQAYFNHSKRFEKIEFLDLSPGPLRSGDPLYAVIGYRAPPLHGRRL